MENDKPNRRPQPPDDLDGEALLEWGRVCDDLDALGTLDAADRAVLTLYVQTWQANQTVARHVMKFGPIAKQHNGVVGQTPHYKTMRETAALLRQLLADLGLTPASRPAAAPDDAPSELSF